MDLSRLARSSRTKSPPEGPALVEDSHPSRLEAALRDYYDDAGTRQPPARWTTHALGAGQRGEALIDTLTNVMPDLRGRRHLDIGCGYGGVCVAAARAGASTIGIDTDERLLELAELNQLDHPDLPLQFHCLDALDWERLSALGTFDAITADNVIEHVAVPEQLVSHIARLLKPDGVAYLTVPNAFSIGQIHADCHYGLFGASLLDTWDAAVYLRHAQDIKNYDVSAYFPFEVYAGFSERESLFPELLMQKEFSDEAQHAPPRDLIDLPLRLEATIEPGVVPAGLHDKLRWAVAAYVTRGQAALAALGSATPDVRVELEWRIRRDYLEEAWYVMASKNPQALRYKRDSLATRALRRLRSSRDVATLRKPRN